jgi:hypothetical protein
MGMGAMDYNFERLFLNLLLKDFPRHVKSKSASGGLKAVMHPIKNSQPAKAESFYFYEDMPLSTGCLS